MKQHPNKTAVYKTTAQIELKIHLFMPEKQAEPTAAILFFHGGAFIKGHPAQFYKQCAYLAKRGMVAGSAEYRLLTNGAKDIGVCLSDSKSAIRWLRANADELNIDSTKIIAAGASAGGNLAANCGMRLDFDDPNDDLTISSVPNALVLFNPVLFKPAVAGGPEDGRFYPNQYIGENVPPMLILHGDKDPILPFPDMEQFALAMISAGNRCDLICYKGKGHGFFNLGRDENRPFFETLMAMDSYLVELGFLSGGSSLEYEDVINWAAEKL